MLSAQNLLEKLGQWHERMEEQYAHADAAGNVMAAVATARTGISAFESFAKRTIDIDDQRGTFPGARSGAEEAARRGGMTPARARAEVARRRLDRLEEATRALEQRRHASQRVWRRVDIGAVLRQIVDVEMAGERLLAALASSADGPERERNDDEP